MYTSYVLASAAALLGHATAQSSTSTSSSTATAVTSGEITIHTVTVGKIENEFDPPSINAVPGDIVSFEFFPGNHSVARAEYGFPCVPYEDITGKSGFHSGFEPVNASFSSNIIFNLTINDTAPVWYYCGAPGSCIGWGMLGVINPGTSQLLNNQIELAKEANFMIEPGEALPTSAFQSLSSLAATATQVTLTVTATNSWEPTASATSATTSPAAAATTSPAAAKSSSALSPGAIAGIVIGAAAVALIAGGLFFMLGRNKSMKEELGRLRRDGTEAPPGTNRHQSYMTEASNGHGVPYMTDPAQGQYGNQLPPYQYTPWHEHKPAGSLGMQEQWQQDPRLSSVATDRDRYSRASEPFTAPRSPALSQQHAVPAIPAQEMFVPDESELLDRHQTPRL
ncbi:hypothetical protein LTR78_003233 [Recurvomyces mirabilis]|uniref:Extracellular serine-rich protein n=1 Tax=Recurvomyces mirabilis TaxID=574656 RepID=A0AAE1C3R7_9PEZI|nr:hypothetical protein LTR78_003233 [Recurvomyces mirabilis]KAK5156950.1 hypothetical protein LTS14_004467 [Recurvomyces mirabilis]